MQFSRILSLLRKYIDMKKLLAENPDISKEQVEEFFAGAERVFSELEGKQDKVVLHVDGASRGNPGAAGIGIVIASPDGKTLLEDSKFIGEATNNEAEYHAVIEGLKAARRLGAKRVTILSDSDLLVHQLRGDYRVKSRRLIPLRIKVADELRRFVSWKVEFVPREANKRADKLAHFAIDEAEWRRGSE